MDRIVVGCVAITLATACSGWRSPGRADVAALRLTCASALHGVRCHLVAFFQDVSRSPRDVTADASWQLLGVRGAHISGDGVIEAPESGDVEIDATYDSQHAQSRVRLTPDAPGQLLAALRGRVYVEVGGALRPVAHVHVEVIAGPSTGLSTTTAEDGSYEFLTVLLGDIAIRATKLGYSAAEGSTEIRAGENRLSLAIALVPRGPGSDSAV